MNPLRPGGIGPYADRTPPTIASVEFIQNGREVDPETSTGSVEIVVNAFDTAPLHVPEPWRNKPVTPAQLGWGVSSGSETVVARRTAVDFQRLLPARLYDVVYAPGTRQNWPRRAGKYRFYLTHGFQLSRLPAGLSLLRIEARDTRGNLAVARIGITR